MGLDGQSQGRRSGGSGVFFEHFDGSLPASVGRRWLPDARLESDAGRIASRCELDHAAEDSGVFLPVQEIGIIRFKGQKGKEVAKAQSFTPKPLFQEASLPSRGIGAVCLEMGETDIDVSEA